uniref:Uncharacterized protein n=1 Tax=Strongyloides papillosus TaxID=174720 RepID=A0A0N5C635_STREA
MDDKKYESFIRCNELWEARRNALFIEVDRLDKKATELQKELLDMDSAVESCKKSDEVFEKSYIPKLSSSIETGSTVTKFCEYKINGRNNTGW